VVESVFAGVVKCRDWGDAVWGVKLADLANPALDSELISKMLRDPEARRKAVLSLSANPQCRPSERTHVQPDEQHFYGVVLCKHGDFDKPDVLAAITSTLHDADAELQHDAIWNLCARGDVPASLVAFLDKKANFFQYQRLAESPQHMTYVANGGTDHCSLRDLVSNGRLKLSPALSAARVSAIYGMFDEETRGIMNDAEWEQARVAAHPNATRFLAETALVNPDITKRLIIAAQGTNSPHEGLFLENAKEMTPNEHVGLRNPDPAMLLRHFYDDCEFSGAIDVLSHPKFPWNQCDVNDVLWSLPEDERESAAAAAFLSGVRDIKYDCVFPVATLFSPTASSVALNNLIEVHSDVAKFAACHPNGGDISIAGSDGDIVEYFRAKFQAPMLAGRLSGAGKSSCEQLVL